MLGVINELAGFADGAMSRGRDLKLKAGKRSGAVIEQGVDGLLG